MEELLNIVSNFQIKNNIKKIEPLGNGLINDTYKVITDNNEKSFVLQRINTNIFKDVEMLQSNIQFVTEHIKKKLEEKNEDNIDSKVLTFVANKSTGKTYYFDGENHWRMCMFISGSKTYETVTPKFSYYAGKAFGKFENMLTDLKKPIGEIIPDFHNMELRLKQFKEAFAEDKVNRLKNEPELEEIVNKINQYGEAMCKAERLHKEGKLPKRICHCDTKVNNILFDDKGNILCVIDLDTVMPSYVFSDFGDFLRTGANTAAEDEENLNSVNFNMEIFKSFTKGYIESTKDFLLPIEKENLGYAACLFPFMQSVRFFTDYINGDTYYKIKYPNHNLIRTKAQMKLFESALEHLDEMNKYIQSL